MWYLDDGAIAGPKLAVLRALAPYFKTLVPLMVFSSTHLNVNDTVMVKLSIFPFEMKSSKTLNFEILGAPIGDFVFCAKYASQKCSKAQWLLHMLEDVGSVDPPQVALLLLRQCGSFCKDGTSCSLHTSVMYYSYAVYLLVYEYAHACAMFVIIACE